MRHTEPERRGNGLDGDGCKFRYHLFAIVHRLDVFGSGRLVGTDVVDNLLDFLLKTVSHNLHVVFHIDIESHMSIACAPGETAMNGHDEWFAVQRTA